MHLIEPLNSSVVLLCGKKIQALYKKEEGNYILFHTSRSSSVKVITTLPFFLLSCVSGLNFSSFIEQGKFVLD
jgi:hypothetical protein